MARESRRFPWVANLMPGVVPELAAVGLFLVAIVMLSLPDVLRSYIIRVILGQAATFCVLVGLWGGLLWFGFVRLSEKTNRRQAFAWGACFLGLAVLSSPVIWGWIVLFNSVPKWLD